MWFLASSAALMTLFFLPLAQASTAPLGSTMAGPNLSIATTDMIGTPLPGYYTTVSQGGVLLQTGFSPASFALPPGRYQVAVSDYGGHFFDRWNDSVTTRVQTVTITATNLLSLTALYFTSATTAPNFALVSSLASIRVATGATGTSTVIIASVNGFDSAVSLTASSSSKGITATFSPVPLTLGRFGTVRATVSVVVASNLSLGTYPLTITAVGGNLSNSITVPLSVSSPAPSDGITIYADRAPASYWASCFALTCALGTGPGAAMWVVLYSASGAVVQTGFANENGYTFTGLIPGATYYIHPSDCDSCHGSTHDVLFAYWSTNDTTATRAVIAGTSVDAWYVCTNGCSGI